MNISVPQIFEYNFVHADLHPGNISVQVASGPPVNQVRMIYSKIVRKHFHFTYLQKCSQYITQRYFYFCKSVTILFVND